MNGKTVLLIAAISTACLCRVSSAEKCINDLSCDGDMICIDGECVLPPDEAKPEPKPAPLSPSPPPPPAPKPPTPKGCTKDIDCKGARICIKGDCVPPKTTTPPAGAPVAASGCTRDSECIGDSICESGKCVAPPEPQYGPPSDRVQSSAGAESKSNDTETQEGIPERPERAARGGIVTGMVFDTIGIILVAVGGGVSNANLSVGINLLYSGAGIMTLASLIGTISSTVKHGRYERVGFDVRGGPKGGSWFMTVMTWGLMGASLGVGLSATSPGMAIASIALAGGAVIFEAINMAVRRGAWTRAMNEAPYVGEVSSLRLFPVVMAYRDPSTGALTGVAGIGGEI